MNLFSRAKAAVGIEDSNLIAAGTLARGNVKNVETGHLVIGNSARPLGNETLCKVTVEVIGLNGEDPYDASCTHAIPQIYLPKLMEPGAAVAIRVDPADPQHIELDLTHDVPAPPIIAVSDDGTRQKVETHKGIFTAAQILAQGQPCTVDVLAIIPLNQTNDLGQEVTGLVLNVNRSDVPAYQAQVGAFIPPDKLAAVTVGARLPAKWVPGPGLPTDANLVCPDWPQI